MIRTGHLTPGERLLILRRRFGHTKAESAVVHKVSLYRYCKWERDGVPGNAIPHPMLGRLKSYEGSFIIRRRAGLSVRRFAALAGVSAWWLTRMERGDVSPARLTAFWGEMKNGYPVKRAPAKLLAALVNLAG